MSSESRGDGGYGVREVHHEQPCSGSGVSHDENLTIGEDAVSGTNTGGEVCQWRRVWCSQLSEVYVSVESKHCSLRSSQWLPSLFPLSLLRSIGHCSSPDVCSTGLGTGGGREQCV